MLTSIAPGLDPIFAIRSHHFPRHHSVQATLFTDRTNLSFQEQSNSPTSQRASSIMSSLTNQQQKASKTRTMVSLTQATAEGERSEGTPDTSPLSARSSPERVVAASRALIEMKSRLFTDCPDFYHWGIAPTFFSKEEVEQRVGEVTDDLPKRSTALSLKMLVARKERNAEGQAFLIKTSKGIVLSTVRHNFCQEINKKGQVEKCIGACLVFPSNETELFPFNRHRQVINWDADKNATAAVVDHSLNWKYGRELEFIVVDDEECADLMSELRNQTITPYKAVSATFEIKERMTVGIVARSYTGMLATSLQNQLAASEEGCTAQAGDVFITVGEITHVGAEHIEYSVNTVPGFSGGAVVLLDSENYCHMHVLAAHTGYSETKETNFGLLVATKVAEYEAA